MIVNLTAFEAGLDRWAQRELPEMVRRAQLKVAFDLFAAIVRLSPVDSGRYRGSWTLAAGDANEETLPPPPDSWKSGDGPYYRNLGKPDTGLLAPVATLAALNVIWIANHLPYAERLEEGHSGQAPTGVAGPVVAAFTAAGMSRGVIATDGKL